MTFTLVLNAAVQCLSDHSVDSGYSFLTLSTTMRRPRLCFANKFFWLTSAKDLVTPAEFLSSTPAADVRSRTSDPDFVSSQSYPGPEVTAVSPQRSPVRVASAPDQRPAAGRALDQRPAAGWALDQHPAAGRAPNQHPAAGRAPGQLPAQARPALPPDSRADPAVPSSAVGENS